MSIIYSNKLSNYLRRLIFKYDHFISFLFKYNKIYKHYLIFLGYNFAPNRPPKIPWKNTTLKNKKQLDLSLKIIKYAKLNLHPRIIEKNWDSLCALDIILQKKNTSSKILDAGGELNSLILHWLYQYGYSNLKAINLEFKKKNIKGLIEFFPGDITETPFPNNYFDVIICLSVIEHGVNLKDYFKEMNRILKLNGLLITSTDYWENSINTYNNYAFNALIHIFDRNEVLEFINIAYKENFKLFGPRIDLRCNERVVFWNKVKEKFTFLIFCLQKKGRS